ncbi:bifunctional enoyl-CoA hydratase/phosphate acetyltransferase [Arhodomonas aquaeolei]|uniref:bifunctional enoyl-CoA hydratase/phosphate acetyltransferase n=1 Tax=Arhodomonas TaxID=2368 RepID=UPI00036BDD41|nr:MULTISPECIES: bifunctional enoyl-CoA hydratase/phosphate acetyltransferase [Arhodomonas]MCS4505138.1 bifunctional enoyl-CoA hydratase/phosphate acetyltransferase [Arhodomonas aquaeolei]
MSHCGDETTTTDDDGLLRGYTFEELKVDQTASLVRQLTERDIAAFAAISGDVNPLNVDRRFAQEHVFHTLIGHGMWAGALISNVLGTHLPGPGTIYARQTFDFVRPIALGTTVTVTVRVAEKHADSGRVVMECLCLDGDGNVLVSSTAEVLPPQEEVRRERTALPDVEVLDHGDRLRRLIESARALPPLHMAVVHPVDDASLLGAVRAAEAGLIVPVLVGPEADIRAAAGRAGLAIDDYRIVPAGDGRESANRAVELVHTGEADALMKGMLHTDELMGAVVDTDTGLRTRRRLSHVFVMDIPGYDRPLLITDAAINIAPSLTDKVDIVQNAVDLAHALGTEAPKVAILCAVETVNPAMPCTVDASVLCKMADRGQITGAVLDGPLAFDNAVDVNAARTKGIRSPVAGHADILLTPDLEAGNMLAKQLEYISHAAAAGVVLGAQVPIALTSRADDELARMASCATAALMHAAGGGNGHG